MKNRELIDFIKPENIITSEWVGGTTYEVSKKHRKVIKEFSIFSDLVNYRCRDNYKVICEIEDMDDVVIEKYGRDNLYGVNYVLKRNCLGKIQNHVYNCVCVKKN